jgi:hypothetical protein
LETGRWGWMHKRSWPTATYPNDDHAGSIDCKNEEGEFVEYYPASVKSGNHPPLTLILYDYTTCDPQNPNCPWVRKRFKAKFVTIPEAKKALEDFLKKHPEVMPAEYKLKKEEEVNNIENPESSL